VISGFSTHNLTKGGKFYSHFEQFYSHTWLNQAF